MQEHDLTTYVGIYGWWWIIEHKTVTCPISMHVFILFAHRQEI